MKQKKKTKEIPYFIKTKLKKNAKYYLVLDFCKAVSGKYCLLSRMSQKVYVEQVAKIQGHWWGNMIYLYFVTVQNNRKWSFLVSKLLLWCNKKNSFPSQAQTGFFWPFCLAYRVFQKAGVMRATAQTAEHLWPYTALPPDCSPLSAAGFPSDTEHLFQK